MKQADKRVSNKAGQNKVSKSVGTTPVPNDLLDRVMPMLRDTELRVLLIIVRQTRGWQVGPEPAHRKERDWLTQSQLTRRTGRASEAVSRAVDALVRMGIIHVTDRNGTPQKTAFERRRYLGRLYYQLGTGGLAGDNAHTPGNNKHIHGENFPESEYAKPNTTKETVIQKYEGDEKQYKGDEKNRDACTRKPERFREKPFVIRTQGWEKATHQKCIPEKVNP